MSEIKKEYNLYLDNETYNIILTKTNNGEDNSILFKARNQNNNLFSYQKAFSLDELMKLSKTFRFCDNTNEALNIISKIFESNNKCFLSKDDEDLNLHLKINLPSGDEQEIKLKLEKIESMENATKEELLERIKLLEEENKELKQEINILIKENNKKDDIIKSLSMNQKTNNLTKNNNEATKEMNNEEEADLVENIINTDIISSQEEIQFIE